MTMTDEVPKGRLMSDTLETTAGKTNKETYRKYYDD